MPLANVSYYSHLLNSALLLLVSLGYFDANTYVFSEYLNAEISFVSEHFYDLLLLPKTS